MIDEALTRLGMPVPDTALARRARELIADVAAPSLVNHSVRSYAWAVELARHDGLQFDPEILYVSSMLHDIGLVPAYDVGGCYEVDGAIAAERLVREAGEPEARARAIHDVIALHNNETLPPDRRVEVVLLWDSTGVDVTGDRFADLRPEIIPGLLAAYPRLDFKPVFAALFVDQATRKPTCPAGEMANTGMLEAIAQAPFVSAAQGPLSSASRRFPMQTRSFPSHPEGRSPAGAEIRFLIEGETGGMIHSTVPPGQVNRATVHATVSEFWHVLSGEGQIWRRDGTGEETTVLRRGVSIDIPVGTAFQYRCTGGDPLRFLCVTMPPWPGAQEATVIEGPWTPTAPEGWP